MTIPKKVTEIFISETFEARDKEWALTEAALLQPAILKGKPLRIFLDKAQDITVTRQMQIMCKDVYIDEIIVTQRALIEYQDKERKIARAMEMQSEIL